MTHRRDFIKKGALLGLAGLANSIAGQRLQDLEKTAELLTPGPLFTLPALPFAYDALEPFIDKKTMEIHHTKHHQAYVDKLNSVPPGDINHELDNAGLCASIGVTTDPLFRNNMGGHYNHTLFWQLLKPGGGTGNKPAGALGDAINKKFGSFDGFRKEFSEKAVKVFGSGWCWLVMDDGGLKITTTPNQDNPLMQVASEKGRPVMALDVWEHAYYLKYQNRRADYIEAWWQVANWEKAAELYTSK